MLQLIETKDIHYSKVNPRRHDKNKPAMAELVASIKALGILQPPSVRKNDTGYEVIFGNRRETRPRLNGKRLVRSFGI